MVLVSNHFLNCFVPKTIMGHVGDYSGTWECVMDPRDFRNTAWAIKGINYKEAGFSLMTTKGFLVNRSIWMAPHHYDFTTNILPIIKSYEEETKKICEEVIKSVGASSMKDMGKVMGTLKSKHADILDFSKVSGIIKGLLN